MQSIWFLFYNILILPLLLLGARFVALFNHKVHSGLDGRRRSLMELESTDLEGPRPLVLFHCASMGEYEQIRPVLRAVKNHNAEVMRVVSFFSPSGFEFDGENPDYDLKVYLPADTTHGVRRFLNLLRPRAVVISKHDIWPNLIWSAKSRKIPVLLVNATMPLDSAMTKPIIRWFFRAVLRDLTVLAPASEADAKGFRLIVPRGFSMTTLGDTRYDQVLSRVEEHRTQKVLPQASLENRRVLVIGSSWPSDDKYLLPAIVRLQLETDDFLVIWVPHEIDTAQINNLSAAFDEAGITWTQLSNPQHLEDLPKARVLIIDRIGYLANLYGHGDMAYVGGSFGPGVHNVMEPAAHGIPVLFGPRILNSPDAESLLSRGAGFRIRSESDAYEILHELLSSNEARVKAGAAAHAMIQENKGATSKMADKILTLMQ